MNLCRIAVQILGMLAIIAILTTLLVLHPWQGSATNNSTNVTLEIDRYNNPESQAFEVQQPTES
jgi:hypothetical protein